MEIGENSYRRYLGGDESAFSELVELYFDKLTFFINGYVHDVHASEDVAIETMTELAIHPGRFAFRSSLKTYLFAAARHKALNYLKKRCREGWTELSEADEADRASLENDVLAGERQKAVAAAMAELPEEQRLAVHLVYLEGLSYRETAKVLKKSEKQVDNLLAAAKKRLRTLLEKEGVE